MTTSANGADLHIPNQLCEKVTFAKPMLLGGQWHKLNLWHHVVAVVIRVRTAARQIRVVSLQGSTSVGMSQIRSIDVFGSTIRHQLLVRQRFL